MGRLSSSTAEPRRMKEAGDLLNLEAIDQTGLAITSEGAFTRILKVTPPNPLVLSAEERTRLAYGYCHLLSRLGPNQSLQFYVQSRPVHLDDILEVARRDVAYTAGDPPSSVEGAAVDPASVSQWRLYGAMEESLRLHADSHAAVEVNHYVVVPFLPRQHVARAALAYARRGKLPTAPLERTLATHRRAVREHLGRVDALRSELEAEGMATELLDGEQVVHLLWSCFNPTKADRGRCPTGAGELLGELDAPVERDAAIQAGMRLREAISGSSLDFDRDSHLAHIDRDAEQTIVVATTAGRTSMGWLHGRC